jgi:hypothetical protein
MALLKTHTKQPADRLDYDFDYSQWLSANDEILSAVFSVESLGEETPPAPMTLSGESVTPTYAKVWAVGGAAGEVYKITCTVTTTRGRVKQDEIKIRLKEY